MSSFDLPLLQSFVVLADELHFGRAADRLMIAQPALSRRIARLEAQLGLTLAERDTRGVRLTPAGRVLADRGRDALAIIERGTAAARGLPQKRGLLLSWNGAVEMVLSAVMGRARAQAPDVEVSFRGLVDEAAVGAVRGGEVDLAVTFGRVAGPEADLVHRPLLSAEDGVMLPDDHPLLRRRRMVAADLETLDPVVLPGHLSPSFAALLMVREVADGERFAPIVRAVFDRVTPSGVGYRTLDPPTHTVVHAVFRRDARADVVQFAALLRRTVDADPDALPAGCAPCASPSP